MEFKDIIMQRYTVKKFTGEMVPEAVLFHLLDIIRFAPSAFNLQPWKVKVISASRIKKLLLPH